MGHDEYAPGRKTDSGTLFDWSRIHFNQASTDKQVHIVKAGESLWLIAQKYGVSMETIAKFSTQAAYLQVGQKLRIPTLAHGITYTVKSGDSLWKIAQKYKLSIETVARLNNLDRNAYLRVGQKLKIPQ
ncbi:LysM peptidoglycan-binding domain-containing protein [Bacillus sp. V59.32b]|uniref:LysM peptidoglycan-binding domain-containing protein n=1 Tax=Bacillus sp. V59.32b TaxID=1758642 RepID=UPI000E3B9FFF|nr:LysM peptidoglycan-binding domain-containing protein [Bacillus sp. V59.32b]RFU60509.1 LysM peptidoglycan-binding domain-containing protein [Bacillus sp. V59.32b]